MIDIRDFINYVCDDLCIDKPIVKTVDELHGSVLAYYNPCTNELVIKDKYRDMYDAYFVVLHELRHKCQVDNGLFNFDTYKLRHQAKSLKEYNMQPEEIDANAYANYVMIMAFNRQATFKGLDDDIVAMIEKRMIEIDNEYD